MEIAVAVFLVLVIGILASVWKIRRRNNDPKQQQLAFMFMRAAASDPRGDAAGEIGEFINSEGWDRVEAAPRIAHALSLVKITQPALYEAAIDVSRRDEMWANIHGALNPKHPP